MAPKKASKSNTSICAVGPRIGEGIVVPLSTRGRDVMTVEGKLRLAKPFLPQLKQIQQGSKVFAYDVESKQLHGVWVTLSKGYDNKNKHFLYTPAEVRVTEIVTGPKLCLDDFKKILQVPQYKTEFLMRINEDTVNRLIEKFPARI